MKVFIKNHEYHAGYWIYNGYFNAWKSLGYDVSFYTNLNELKNEKNYYLMSIDYELSVENIDVLNNSIKTFLHVQPNRFPEPWGKHPNYITNCNNNIIQIIKKLSNVKQWTFMDINKEYFSLWNPTTIPLAFDSISYNFTKKQDHTYDICYVGGRANNGYDEKYKIMMNIFKHFKDSGLNCGFFVEKNITHEEEQSLLSSSKLCLNIHDAYQRLLSLDTNERTFKSLGLNGMLACEKINQITNIIPNIDIILDDQPNFMIEKIKQFLSLTEKEQKEIKDKNKKIILNEHCYINRIQKMMSIL